MSDLRYILRRSVKTVVLLWVAVTMIWGLFRLLPGGYENLLLLEGASPAQIQAFREHWGLNDPLYVQYWRYLMNLLVLDMGTSIQFRVPVWEFVRMKMFNSFVLIAPPITLAYLLGSGLGAVMGINRGSILEKYGIIPILAIDGMPAFFLGILGILIFSITLGWVPTSGMLSTMTLIEYSDAPWWRPYLTADFARHWILPASVILLRYLYLPTLLMRTNIIELSNQGFVYYQRMTGLPYARRLKHLIHHASLPVITMYPITMTRAIGGLVLIELVFNWPGIGSALVQAVFARDAAVVQFVLILVAVFIVLANFLVDVIYTYVDPRISLEDMG